MSRHNSYDWKTSQPSNQNSSNITNSDSILSKRPSPPTDYPEEFHEIDDQSQNDLIKNAKRIKNLFKKGRLILEIEPKKNVGFSVIDFLDELEESPSDEKIQFFEDEGFLKQSEVSFDPCLGVNCLTDQEPLYKILENQVRSFNSNPQN